MKRTAHSSAGLWKPEDDDRLRAAVSQALARALPKIGRGRTSIAVLRAVPEKVKAAPRFLGIRPLKLVASLATDLNLDRREDNRPADSSRSWQNQLNLVTNTGAKTAPPSWEGAVKRMGQPCFTGAPNTSSQKNG